MTPDQLIERGNKLFSEKQSLDSLWQNISEMFYPQRANFTTAHYIGAEYNHQTSSYPALVCRDLGSQFAGMLRRDDWFDLALADDEADTAGKQWLAGTAKRMRRLMYAQGTNFVRTTKEGDMDFAAFGQTVIQVAWWYQTNNVLYRSWHLKDCAWSEDATGEVDELHRKWKPTARELVDTFGEDKVHDSVLRILKETPTQKIECRSVMMPEEDGYQLKTIDVEHRHDLEDLVLPYRPYIVPRWQTVSGSQYAHSPATIIGLPDARLIQDMNRILLDAGERAVDPPMVAQAEVVRGDMSLFAGGVTYVDKQYDERAGKALQPLLTDKSAIPLGMDMELNVRQTLAEVFFLNKLTLPPLEQATAYEVRQRVQEYVRQALPIFEPVEQEYNQRLCESTFEICMRAGALGPMDDMPKSLQGREVEFTFTSPISDALERNKVGRFQEAAEILATVAQMDPTLAAEVDMKKALREAVEGSGSVEWLHDEKDAEVLRQQAVAVAGSVAAQG